MTDNLLFFDFISNSRYIDKEGKIYKPFVLPQQDPAHYFHTFKSYNIPELSKSPLPFDAVDIKEIYLNSPAEPFK